MQSVRPLPAAAVPHDELRAVLSDHLALDRARSFRRLIVARFGILTLVALVVGTIAHGLSPFARWVPIGLYLVAPAWAWAVELRLERQLSRRLDALEALAGTHSTPNEDGQEHPGARKS